MLHKYFSTYNLLLHFLECTKFRRYLTKSSKIPASTSAHSYMYKSSRAALNCLNFNTSVLSWFESFVLLWLFLFVSKWLFSFNFIVSFVLSPLENVLCSFCMGRFLFCFVVFFLCGWICLLHPVAAIWHIEF